MSFYPRKSLYFFFFLSTEKFSFMVGIYAQEWYHCQRYWHHQSCLCLAYMVYGKLRAFPESPLLSRQKWDKVPRENCPQLSMTQGLLSLESRILNFLWTNQKVSWLLLLEPSQPWSRHLHPGAEWFCRPCGAEWRLRQGMRLRSG